MACRGKSIREGRQCDVPLLFISRARSSNRVTAQAVEEEPVPAFQWRVSPLPMCTSQAKQQHGNAARSNEDSVERESCDGSLLQQLDVTTVNAAVSGGARMTGTLTSTALAESTEDNHTYISRAITSCNDTDASLLSMVDVCSLSTALTAHTDSKDDKQDSSRGSTAIILRVRTEAMGAALRQTEPPGDHQGGSKVPHIKICGGEEGYSTVSTVPKFLATRTQPDGAPRDRRDWIATPHLISPRRTAELPIRPRDARKHSAVEDYNKVFECQARRCGAARCLGNDGALESRVVSQVPAPPQNQTHTPRPIWAILRNRTLRVARQDPCIFSRGSQCRFQKTINMASTARQLKSWHIINRRIFGFREMPRRGSMVQPEWMVFGGGLPPQGLDEQNRWMLRLGRIGAETIF